MGAEEGVELTDRQITTVRSGLLAIAVLLGLQLPSALSLGQTRFDHGELKGFTRSPTEHIINRHEGLLKAAIFVGDVADPAGAPMRGAVVEARGPEPGERVVGTVVDEQGRFKLGHLREGRYAFKITFNGFQSIVGRLEIAKRAGRKPVKFVLQVGV